MKQEEKELLIKDLCGRLPYEVKCQVELNRGEKYSGVMTLTKIDPSDKYAPFYCTSNTGSLYLEFDDVKPYLFPLSSITLEQKKELCKVGGYESREEDCGYHSETFYYNMVGHENVFYPDADDIDWLNKNHFDYRGLIEKDLALDATGLNIY